jgi:hypothetical protein
MSPTAENATGVIQIVDDSDLPTRRNASHTTSEKQSATSDLEQGAGSPAQDTYLDFDAKKKQVQCI